jgi:hypothetical protein
MNLNRSDTPTDGYWEYEVEIGATRYWVAISDDHAVQSVSRVVNIEGTGRRAGKGIWHKNSSHMTREAGRAIRAARAVEQGSALGDLKAQMEARPDTFTFLSEEGVALIKNNG